MAQEIDRELGRGYAHMTDEEVAADLKRRFGKPRIAVPKDEKPKPKPADKDK